MPIVYMPEQCVWSPDPIAGPDTEATEKAIDTDEPDGGRGRGNMHRLLLTADAGQSQSAERFRVRGVQLPDTANEAAALAAWRAQGQGQGEEPGGGRP